MSSAFETAVKTVRFLSVDAVEKANSGHPGTPMALAGIGVELFTRTLRYVPTEPDWPNRDRFVLSAGHASMLLYSLLHLAGYDLSLDQLKAFRQWGSKTPGHPEVGHTPGVETTTGPLGQGVGNAVGLALAGKMMGARVNEPGDALIDYRVFAIAGDGDMMEGVASEAASIAGHLGLDNLVLIYDDNKITIDGSTALSFSEDVGKRFEAYGWFVQHTDGHDPDAVRSALDAAIAEAKRPSLIVARTHIAIGAPTKQDTSAAHGAPSLHGHRLTVPVLPSPSRTSRRAAVAAPAPRSTVTRPWGSVVTAWGAPTIAPPPSKAVTVTGWLRSGTGVFDGTLGSSRR